jgi:hypothetical protein
MDNKRHGVGRLTLPDGSLYEGEWADGLRDGRGTLIDAAGNEMTGPWRKGTVAGPLEIKLPQASPWANPEL